MKSRKCDDDVFKLLTAFPIFHTHYYVDLIVAYVYTVTELKLLNIFFNQVQLLINKLLIKRKILWSHIKGQRKKWMLILYVYLTILTDFHSKVIHTVYIWDLFLFSFWTFKARDSSRLYLPSGVGFGNLLLYTVSLVGIQEEERRPVHTIEWWVWNSTTGMRWRFNER